MSNFPCSLTRNIMSHSMKNLVFHSLLRRKTIKLAILTTFLPRLCYKFLLPHLYIFSLKGWENVLFELRSERVKYNFGFSSRLLTTPKTCQFHIFTCSFCLRLLIPALPSSSSSPVLVEKRWSLYWDRRWIRDRCRSSNYCNTHLIENHDPCRLHVFCGPTVSK